MEMFTVVQYMWYSLLCQALYLAASRDNKLYGFYSRHLHHSPNLTEPHYSYFYIIISIDSVIVLEYKMVTAFTLPLVEQGMKESLRMIFLKVKEQRLGLTERFM